MALQAGGGGTKKISHFFFALILCLAVSNTKANTSKTNGTCGGTLTGTSGTFSSPGFIVGSCTWTIITDIDRIVRIAFNTFNISCYMDYIEVWDGNGSSALLLDHFCHKNPEGELRSTGNTLVVHHMTYDSTWNSSFSAVWSAVRVNKECGGALSNHITQGTLVSPCYLNDSCTYDNWMVCVWTITVSNGNRIYLHFNDIQLEGSDGCYKEYVAIWDGTSDMYRRFCYNNYYSFRSNQNSMTVVFSSNGNVTSKGFSAHWNTVCDTSIPWDYNKTIESPGYPDEYYGGQNCRYSFSGNSYSTLRVIFTYFHLPNTSCDTDYIEVYNNSYQQQRYCHNSLPPNLTDIYELRFVSNSSASAGYGFQARVSRELNCGNTEIRLQENVEYYLHFKHYEHLEGKCEWTATAEKGLAIMMIGHFSCYDNDCINRFIKIYNETSKDQSSLITPRYSRYGEIFVDEAANTMLLEYVTSNSYYFYTSVTFMAYNATHQNFTCGSTNVSAEEGNITFTSYASPSINGYYKNGICTWTIEAKEDEVIQLVFRDFHIESNLPGCNESAQSYLEIFDESQTEDNLLLKVCRYDIPHLVTSATQRLVVVLTLDEDYGFTRASFTAQYKSFDESAKPTSSKIRVLRDCGGNITGDEGVVSSPNYPANYDNLRVCEWRITVEDTFNVRVEVHELDIPYSYNWYRCTGDSLLFTGVSSSHYMGPDYLLCGHYYEHYLPPIHSANNTLTMRFVSDWENTGRGFNVSWRKVCDHTLDVSSGWIASPRYPDNYYNNMNCSYLIRIPNDDPGYFITFTFYIFDLQGPDTSGSCVYDYLEILQSPSYNPGGEVTPPNDQRFCGRKSEHNLTTYFPTMLQFVTDESITMSGFSIFFVQNMAECGKTLIVGERGFISSPNHPGTFPRYINCTTTIQVEAGHNITLTFESFFLGDYLSNDNGNECWWGWPGGVLEIYDGLSSTSVLIGKYCGYVSPLPITSSGSALTLIFTSHYNHYATGFNATYVSSSLSNAFRDCGGQLNGTSGEITSPKYPDTYPNSAVCEWIINGDKGDTIKLSFVDFHLQDSMSCQRDSLEMRDGDRVSAPRLDRVCGDAIPHEVMSTGNSMLVRFVTDGEITYRGFKASWTSVCEETYRTTQGIIQSPSYPYSHPGRKECTYFIEQRWEGYVVELTFTNFNLGDITDNCTSSYVEVRDGGLGTSPLLGGRYCGKELPPVLTSSQSLMWIRFVTDGSSSNNGFRATFRTGAPSCGSRTLTEKQGVFTSPNFPNIYSNNLYCTWLIQGEQNDIITLTFTSFQLETSSGCHWDWVKVYNGNNLIKTFCGSTIPLAITINNNVATIQFRTDGSSGFQGFSAYYVRYNPNSDDLKRQYDLYPYGEANGDSLLPKKKDNVAEVYIKTGFPLRDTLQYNAFVAYNGLVSFGKKDKGKKLKLKKDRMQILPFHSDIGVNSKDGAVYYHLYTNNRTILDKATAEVREFTHYKDYTASLVLVATWHRVSHERSTDPDTEHATFQVALISNGRMTFGIIFWKHGEMKWVKINDEKLIIGVTNGNENEAILSEYSNTRSGFPNLDITIGNTGRYGMQIYELGNKYSADQACQDWYDRNLPLDSERQTGFRRLPQCPCHWNFLWSNWIWSHYLHDYAVTCYRMSLGRSRPLAPHGQECCYRWRSIWWQWSSSGQFIADAPDAGSATAFNPVFWSLRADYQREDREAHDTCCYGTTSPEYCQMYYKLRPVRACTTRIPFSFSFTWGDPHIKTLDGGEYTFNGWGEYIMFSMMTPGINFTLQGRTGLAETENGTLTNATVFTAFGAEENKVQVFVELQNGTDSMIIFGDNMDYTKQFMQQQENFLVETDAFTLRNDNGSLAVTFSSGIGLTVSVGFKSLDIAVSMPEDFRGLTKGLLGNFNGNPDDDFLLPNETTLNSNLTDRQIYENFGHFWAVTLENTIMRYPPRRGPANYSHPDFVPIFLDEQPSDVLQAARATCGDAVACIYDYVATGSAAMASASKDTAEKADEREKISNNTGPVLTFNATLTLKSGQPYTFNLGGFDPDIGDFLTYHVVNKSDDVVKLDPKTGDAMLNVSSGQPVSIRSCVASFYAEDSLKVQSSVRDVSLIACSEACTIHGTCDFLNPIPTDVATFFLASCTCAPGWIGDDCDENFDACQESPCGAEQECVDLTPAEQGNSDVGFLCGDCQSGFVRDPHDWTRCLDIDECTSSTLSMCGRNATCENTPGSYICVCADGFRLRTDSFNCDDINECAEHTDNCQQVCVNTEGSFQCHCYPGYTPSDKGTCEPESQMNDTCATAGCDHGCILTPDPNGTYVASCFCNAGFRMSGNGTCVDRDECSEGVCSQACVNTVGSFFCKCYTGYLLGSDERTCSPCPSMQYGTDCSLTCQCSGRAVTCDPVSGCVCREGWRGIRCDEDIDECAENPDRCGVGHLCSNTNGSFTCDCPPGYFKNATGNCSDVDECAPGSVLNVCGELEDCINVPGTFYCRCRTGYRQQNSLCIDIDECANGGANCEQLCVNLVGSYKCECRYGYTIRPDRTTCYWSENVCNEFTELDCQHGCTLDDNDRAVCFCRAGFQLNQDNRTCREINPCDEGTSGCSHKCEKSGTYYRCSCPPGMMLDNDQRTCIECPTGTYGQNCAHVCGCGTGASKCNATIGCMCQSGWAGAKCTDDINECENVSIVMECQHLQAECYNFMGGYRCQCATGFTSNDSGACQDVDECAGGSTPCDQICKNTPGSFRCLCFNGFVFNTTQLRCQDVDECALTATNNCTQRCDNTLGSYRCGCHSDDFVLDNDGITCLAVSDCSRSDCPTQNGGCSKDTCYCDDGYELSATSPHTCDAPVDDLCKTDNPCEQLCSVTSDGKSVTCSCDDNHVLNQDERTCRELTKVATEVTVDIPVPSSDLSNNTTYDQWRRQAEDVLQNKLKQTVPGLSLVKVTALRIGSLIIEFDVVVDDESNPYAVSLLVYALAGLSANSLTIGGLSGTVSVRVLGKNVDADSVCEIYTSISKCPEKQHCHADNGQPMCRVQPQDDAPASQSLIIGLAVSAFAVLAITVVVLAIVVMKKSSKKRKQISDQNRGPGHANFMSSIPANDGQYPRNAIGEPVFFASGKEFNYSRKSYGVDKY